MMQSSQPLSPEAATQTVIEFIANVPLFDSMEQNELEVAARHMKLIPFSDGDILFREWEKGDYACFIVDGTLDVMKRCDGDRYKTVTSLERGKSIGELSIVENFPRLVTLKARTRGWVVTFSREDFESLLKAYTEIGIKILKGIIGLLGHNLRKTSSRLSDYMMPMS